MNGITIKKAALRIILPLLVVIVALSAITFTRSPELNPTAEAATLGQQKNQLGVLKDKYSEAKKKTANVRSELSKTQGSIKTNLQRKDELDAEIVALTEEIKNAEELIAAYETSLAEKQTEKETLEKKKQEQIETLGEILKTSYMYGEESYIDLILGSKDISDFLQRLDFISYHVKYSDTLIKDMELTAITLDEVTASLQTTLDSMNATNAEREARVAELTPLLAEVDEIILELQNDSEYLESQLAIEERDTAVLEKDIKALEKQIAAEEARKKKEEEERKKKEAAANKGKDTTPIAPSADGKFIWPIKGYRPLTSSYGYRKDPITGKRAFHNGLDIAAPHGTNIYAVKSGTVIRASRYDTYGECVMIDHGGGMITLYAHCSGYNVKVGQKVNQGEVIAFVGSTGRSTGNHLHFVVRVNGQYKDPNTYLP